jgi:hypothetical protein
MDGVGAYGTVCEFGVKKEEFWTCCPLREKMGGIKR